MNRRWLVLGVAFSACFSEPPGAGSSGSGSSTGSVTDPGSEGSTSSSTGPTDGTTAGPGSGPTTAASSTAGSTTLGDGTVGDETIGDDSGNPPPVEFCMNQQSPHLIACRDFDGEDSRGWGSYEVEGFTRDEDVTRPPAHSAPNFATVRRNGNPVTGDAAQALFGTDFGAADLQGASVGLQVRFPLEFGSDCGNEPIRLFEIRYGGSGGSTGLVLEASPNELIVFYFSPSNTEAYGPFEVTSPVPPGGWRRLDLELVFDIGENDATLTIDGEFIEPPTIPTFVFAPEDQTVSVNVGPWFAQAEAPGAGCGYDLDDLRLEGIPAED